MIPFVPSDPWTGVTRFRKSYWTYRTQTNNTNKMNCHMHSTEWVTFICVRSENACSKRTAPPGHCVLGCSLLEKVSLKSLLSNLLWYLDWIQCVSAVSLHTIQILILLFMTVPRTITTIHLNSILISPSVSQALILSSSRELGEENKYNNSWSIGPSPLLIL